jgi:DNA-binding winged helix-turn-helix (wHTH) protein
LVIRVNVVTEDAVLARRLTTYARRIDRLNITTTDSSLPEERVDAYVVPVEQASLLLDGASRPPTWLPVLAYGGASDLPAAFLAGCRDYLREPWSPEELSFRVVRIMNTSRFPVSWGQVRLSTGFAATKHGEVALSSHEYRILRVLLMQSGKPVPREVLYYALWGRSGRSSRTVDVHISLLRKKLRVLAPSISSDRLICSARGCGYFIPSSPEV